MNPGRLDRRIEIQLASTTRDEVGSVIESWETQYSAWAEIPRDSGKEQEIASADRPQETRQFRIRYKEGLRPDTHRILYQSKAYDIRHIGEEGRENTLILTAVHNYSIT